MKATKITKIQLKEVYTMKSYVFPVILAMLILAGCSSTKDVADYDDVYYSTRAEKKQVKAQEMQSTDPDYYIKNEDPSTDYYIEDYEAGEYVSYEEEPAYSESETVENPDGTTNITNNYYGPGGLYDYAYSARINRFYNPYMGFGYYSPCYVGFMYDPWFNPYWYGPSFQFGMSWGWGNFGWGYPGWGYPGWGWGNPWYGYPYNNYWLGYNHGYWDGYYASGEWGSGSYYYGPRTSHSGSNTPFSRAQSGYSVQPSKSTYVERNRPALSSGLAAVPAGQQSSASGSRTDDYSAVKNASQSTRAGAGLATGRSAAGAVGQQKGQDVPKSQANTDKPRYIYKKPATRDANNVNRYVPGSSISSRSEENQPTRRYSKPDNVTNNRNVSRSTDASSRQRSVYSRPESNSNPLYTRPSQRENTSRYTQPSNTRRSYTQPSRTNTRSYSQPSRSSVEYKRPSNSYNNSRRSYSRPSTSGRSRSSSGIRSTSSPSRSSGGGGRSSGSRSSGGRR